MDNSAMVQEAYERYAVSKDNVDFLHLYGMLDEDKRKNEAIFLRKWYGDPHMAQQVFDSTILNLLQLDNVLNFLNAFRRSLKNARLNMLDSTYRRTKRYRLEVDREQTDNEGAPTPNEVTDDYVLEEHVYERLYKKKEPDKRQLVEFLCDPAKVDSVTTLIVTKFSQYPSITALAKALGLHHEVVKRKLRALSRRYDANRFGDIADYLAV